VVPLHAVPVRYCSGRCAPTRATSRKANMSETFAVARPPAPAGADWVQVRPWRVQMRKFLIGERLKRAPAERAAEGERVKLGLRELVDLTAYPVIGIYWPVRGEIDVRDLGLEHLHLGGRVGLPVVVQPGAPVEFWSWTEGAPMRRGIWNIPIPEERVLLQPGLLLVPLVGFDAAGYRLGYGGGYYDRTFAAAAHQRPHCVGLGYADSHLGSIYPQPHDIPMHEIVTADAVSSPRAPPSE
jgi:5-formyltetrahydrofolate cyclo-ligase